MTITAHCRVLTCTFQYELTVEIGRQALEVVTGSHTPEQYAEFARYADQFDLAASCGSDFHGPGDSYRDTAFAPSADMSPNLESFTLYKPRVH